MTHFTPLPQNTPPYPTAPLFFLFYLLTPEQTTEELLARQLADKEAELAEKLAAATRALEAEKAAMEKEIEAELVAKKEEEERKIKGEIEERRRVIREEQERMADQAEEKVIQQSPTLATSFVYDDLVFGFRF